MVKLDVKTALSRRSVCGVRMKSPIAGRDLL
jgi:hypothetical protein